MIDERLKQLLAAPAVYGYLVTNCLDLREQTFLDIQKHWRIDEQRIWKLGVVSPPTAIGNSVISVEIAKRFDDSVLALVPGFYVDYDRWRLDLNPKLAARGILLPIRNEKNWIVALRVFRHARDERSFLLTSRLEVAA